MKIDVIGGSGFIGNKVCEILNENNIEFCILDKNTNPKFASNRKIFPDSDLEFTRPTKMDLFGFIISCFVCVVVIGLLTWLASVGAS